MAIRRVVAISRRRRRHRVHHPIWELVEHHLERAGIENDAGTRGRAAVSVGLVVLWDFGSRADADVVPLATIRADVVLEVFDFHLDVDVAGPNDSSSATAGEKASLKTVGATPPFAGAPC